MKLDAYKKVVSQYDTVKATHVYDLVNMCVTVNNKKSIDRLRAIIHRRDNPQEQQEEVDKDILRCADDLEDCLFIIGNKLIHSEDISVDDLSDITDTLYSLTTQSITLALYYEELNAGYDYIIDAGEEITRDITAFISKCENQRKKTFSLDFDHNADRIYDVLTAWEFWSSRDYYGEYDSGTEYIGLIDMSSIHVLREKATNE